MAGGVRTIFAFGSPAFRKLGRSPDSLSDSELLDLIESEPRYLRRPLAVRDGKVYVGGKAVAGLT
jgi:arsenate reductase-like glutaredoxin family protein